MPAMTNLEFETLSALIYRKSGINLGELKMELLSARLGKRLRALKLPSVHSYMQRLQEDKSGLELERLVDVVTTNKTEFFREAKHYEHLVQALLPAYLGSAAAKRGQPLRVWSAACSSGEEPYSLAMVLHEALAGRARFKILATDISSPVLHRAMRGSYSQERMEGVPPLLRERYFDLEEGSADHECTVKPLLREAVHFSRFNLTDESQYVFENRFDAIFCRNVMIYFDRPTQESVVGRLGRHLAPGGYLYTGFSESLIGIRHDLKPSGASVYQARATRDALAPRD
jgi:chemotaxis protein methyltransferase CheR